ncbi:MAG: succinylglutamate desuccinylase [Aureispira sp.]
MTTEKRHSNRIIGERIGKEPGPLLVILAQIHGNEPAGYKAVQELFRAIDKEKENKPNFEFVGGIVGILGNVKAAEKGVRYIDKDLNRSWLPEAVERIRATDDWSQLDAEDQEIKANLEVIDAYRRIHKPTRTIILDLHTTTAHGGIFSIPAPNDEARRMALAMHAPVLHGFLEGLKGTSLHYFSKENFEGDMNAVCFEAGQHQDEDSHKHAVSAIIQCFKSVGGFYAKDIESKHDQLLAERSNGLPLEAKLVYVHGIEPADNFSMVREKIYNNFDPIEKGVLLAKDKNGPIKAPYGGLILMPLYQKQGSDGFFIVQEITSRSIDPPSTVESSSATL